jgi:hypothetical protein
MIAIFLSMLVSGFWHGAGWTFVLWGGLHGAALVANHWWKKMKLKMPYFLGWLITFNFVNITFVFFRAKKWDDAMKVLMGMVGAHGVMLHTSLERNPVFGKLGMIGVTFGNWLNGIKGYDKTYFMVISALLVVTLAKNSQQLIAYVKPNGKCFCMLLLIAFWSLLNMSRVSEFLYFQF